MKKYIPYFYIALFLLICLIPSAGLLLGRAEESAENRTAAKAPVLWDEKGVNLHVLVMVGGDGGGRGRATVQMPRLLQFYYKVGAGGVWAMVEVQRLLKFG